MCSRIAGSRSRSATSNGVARKTDENVPISMPTNSASAMSRSVPAPRMNAPTNRIAPTGSSATTEVLIDRTSVWLTARLAFSAYVNRDWSSVSAVFSRTLSNTTTVS